MKATSVNDRKDLAAAVAKGAAWMVALRWAIRGIGVVSTIVLARLLAPEDFGVVALTSLFAKLLDVLTDFGVDMALIQRRDSSREHFDTAWTIKLIQSAVVAGLVVLVAPAAASFFSEPRVTALMMFVSMTLMISGLENIGIVVFRKELEFHREFGFRVAIKLSRFLATVLLALWLRNYWALVWGSLITRVVAVVLSYVVQSYRPRLCIAKFADLWSFSQWMIVRNLGMYARKQFDGFAVGRYFATAQMGIYSLSKEIAEMPTTELVWPMSRALFPGYVKLADDPKRLGRAFLKSLGIIAIIAMPAGVGLALVAGPLVNVLLGERYAEVAPILVWLSLYNVVLTLSASVQNPLMALGQMRRLAGLVWTQTIVAIPVIVLAALQRDLVILAHAQLALVIVLLPVFFHTLVSTSLFGWLDLWKAVWRPTLATGAMAAAVFASGLSGIGEGLLGLAVRVVVGAAAFSVVQYACWRVSGQPDGAERLLWNLASRGRSWTARSWAAETERTG